MIFGGGVGVWAAWLGCLSGMHGWLSGWAAWLGCLAGWAAWLAPVPKVMARGGMGRGFSNCFVGLCAYNKAGFAE